MRNDFQLKKELCLFICMFFSFIFDSTIFKEQSVQSGQCSIGLAVDHFSLGKDCHMCNLWYIVRQCGSEGEQYSLVSCGLIFQPVSYLLSTV